MCGRYYRTADKQAIAEYFHSAAASDEPPAGYNIAPGTTQPVIRQARETFIRELVGMRWGLIGFGPSGPGPETPHIQRQVRKPRKEQHSGAHLFTSASCLCPASMSGARPTKRLSASPCATSRFMLWPGYGTPGRVRPETGCRASRSSPSRPTRSWLDPRSDARHSQPGGLR